MDYWLFVGEFVTDFDFNKRWGAILRLHWNRNHDNANHVIQFTSVWINEHRIVEDSWGDSS